MTRLLDTREWNSLTPAQKKMVTNLYGNGPTYYDYRFQGTIRRLAELGLVTVKWGGPGQARIYVSLKADVQEEMRGGS
jgi:hypothetical protein